MPICDIIIPAFNRPKTLQQTLEFLYAQEAVPGWQARVVISHDDFTNLGMRKIAQQFAEMPNSFWLPPLYVKSEDQSVAAARNVALDVADGDLVLFLGADIFLQPNALQQHLEFANSATVNQAALGMVRWDPVVKPSPLMDWMIHGGNQNDFDSVLGVTQIDPRHFFYASHISIARSFIGDQRFSIQYTSYGWEDLDFGRTLALKGLELFPLPHAVGHHHHYYSPQALRRRQYAIGRNVAIYQRRFPKDEIVALSAPWSWKKRIGANMLASTFLWWLVGLASERWTLPWLYGVALECEFWRGVKKSTLASKGEQIQKKGESSPK